MDLKERTVRISSYLQRLAAHPETEKVVYRHDVEGFGTLCSKLRIPANYTESLKSLVFPPILIAGWPTSPPSPPGS